MQVDRVAGDADGENLARAVAGDLLAVGIAGQKDAAVGWQVALADEIATRVEPAQPIRQVKDQAMIFLRQVGALVELAQQVA